MSDRYPAVQRLALHDETAKKLKFKKAKGGIAEVDSGEPGTTTLNEFFRACANNLSALGHQAKDLTYQEFPKYFWWADGKEWRPRVRPTVW
ncbi:hypothetical protein PGT21_034416 [Puccinia graminis f. sp. tritici]|uniref:Uncharacterized protein n=1 Tax=Puccinia graminis f. sp. tritici TaxID=56615 RepID=A0A5B0QCT4_PUCGR|nr:hypothetical protein PGT21_034416 [Puccinia graminis f. sp. tritici]